MDLFNLLTLGLLQFAVVRQGEVRIIRGYEMLRKVFEQPSSGNLMTVLQLQKAAEIGGQLAAGQSTKFFLPADISTLFGFADQLTQRSSSR